MSEIKNSKNIGSRQIHLDFHTSEYLEGLEKNHFLNREISRRTKASSCRFD